MMIMTITFLKYMAKIEFNEPIDILYLGGGLALVGLAIKLSHSGEPKKSDRFKKFDSAVKRD